MHKLISLERLYLKSEIEVYRCGMLLLKCAERYVCH